MGQKAALGDRVSKSARSSQMIQCLRANLLYSEKRMRDILFHATEEILDRNAATGTLVRASRLIRDIAIAGRRRGESAGIESRNWEMASKAVVNTMIRAGVLLAEDGHPISPGLAGQAAAVLGVEPGFEQRSEAYLLEFLIRKMGDISTHDHTALAHALFRQFDPEVAIDDLEDHVVVLLATLAGSVELAEDGKYVAGESMDASDYREVS